MAIDDLRDALSAAYDKVEETADAGDTGSADTPVRGNDIAPSVGDGGADGATHADRARDEAGRFAKAEEAKAEKKRETLSLKKGPKDATPQQERPGPADQVKLEPGGRNIQDGASGVQPKAVGADAPILPPPHWEGRGKIEWERLPYHVKQTLSQEYQTVAELRNLAPVLEPLKQRFAQEFGGTDRALAAILGTWQQARQQPLDFVKGFIQSFGIDPQALVGPASVTQQAGQPELSVDPTVATLQQELAAVRTQLQAVAQQPLIAQQNQIQAEVTTFQNEVKDGKLAHPYYNDVKPRMAALFQTGAAKSLQDAYDQACWADPGIRATLIAADQARQADERRRTAETARQAAVQTAGAPGHRGSGKPQTETVGQTLERAWDAQLNGARA